MPQTTEFAIEYDCDTPTSPLQQGEWTGVQLSYILSQAIVSPGAIKVAMSSPEGYYIVLPVDTATADNTIILAYQFQGAALPVPVLVIPSKSGDNWIFGPTQIVLVNHNFVGNYQLEGGGFGPTADSVKTWK
jgi:DMSO/TMAO reductase YedYZ molybdopterin-dependent catalytic subunit